MGLEEDADRLLQIASQGKTTQEQSLQELVQRIWSGETTGDPIRDFCIVFSSYPPLDEQLRTLKADIDSHQGEQILVVKTRETQEGCTCFGGSGFLGREQSMRLGVLDGKLSFNFKAKPEIDELLGITEKQILLPTTQHTQITNRYSRDKQWELKDGPITLSAYEMVHFGKELPRRGLRESVSVGDLAQSLRIIMGSEKIAMVYRLRLPLKNQAFERFISEEMTEAAQRLMMRDKPDTKYVQALELLGLEPPQDFVEARNKERFRAQYSVIENIDGDLQKINALKRTVRNIYSIPEKEGVMMEGGALTLIEDEDDAKVVSMGPRMEIKQLEGDIRRELGKALKLGMHQGDLRVNLTGIRGTEIATSDYIIDLCSRYEVPIPK